MTAKSIIDVEVNDEEFQRFHALFLKHQKMVKELAGDWGKTNTTIDQTAESLEAVNETTEQVGDASAETDKRWASVGRTTVKVQNNFESMAAALMAQLHFLRDQEKEEARQHREQQKNEQERRKAEDERGRKSRKLVQDAKSVARSTMDTVQSIAKWSVIAGGGLLGLGGAGLFGLDRLADVTANARRSSLGLGVTTGEQQAFRINFGRFFDADNTLQNVAEAKADYSKRWAFNAMGVNPNGKDPAQLAVEMAMKAKGMFDRSDQSEQYAQAHGLLQFFTMDELRRLHNTSAEELRTQAGNYGRDRGKLGLSDDTLRRWQDFSTQMHRAGLQIETVLVRGLEGLTPGITKLSQSLADIVQATMDSPQFKKWVAGLGDELKHLAEYLGSDDFHAKLNKFIEGAGLVADEIYAVAEKLKWLLPTPGPAGTDKYVQGDRRIAGTGGNIGASNSSDYSNPGNLRVPGAKKFQVFSSRQQGIYAMAQQLRRYETEKKWGNADTIEKIVKLYAPPNENNTEKYIQDVSKWTGYKRDQHLDLRDRGVLATLEAAMLHKENAKYNKETAPTVASIIQGMDVQAAAKEKAEAAAPKTPAASKAPAGSPRQVVVTIHNATGGSAVATTNQLAQ